MGAAGKAQEKEIQVQYVLDSEIEVSVISQPLA